MDEEGPPSSTPTLTRHPAACACLACVLAVPGWRLRLVPYRRDAKGESATGVWLDELPPQHVARLLQRVAVDSGLGSILSSLVLRAAELLSLRGKKKR